MVFHFFLELRKKGFELLRRIKPWDFAGGDQRVEELEELGSEDLVVLDKQARFLGLNTRLLEHDFEVTLEFLHAVLSIDVWTEERHIQEMRDEETCLLSTNS